MMLIIVQRIIFPVYLWLILKDFFLEQLVKAKIDIYTKDNFFSLLLPFIALPPSVWQKAQMSPYFLLSQIKLAKAGEQTELEINLYHLGAIIHLR